MSETPYERAHRKLGLQPGASLSRIQEQYRFLAFVFHPDRVPEGTMKFRVQRQLQEINLAREFLVRHHEQTESAASGNNAAKDSHNNARANSQTDAPPSQSSARQNTSEKPSSSDDPGRWWQPPPGYSGRKTGWRSTGKGYWADGEWHSTDKG